MKLLGLFEGESKPFLDMFKNIPLPDITSLPWWVWVVLAIVVFGILSTFVKPVATALVWIVKIVFFILTAPFKLVIWLFSKKEK